MVGVILADLLKSNKLYTCMNIQQSGMYFSIFVIYKGEFYKHFITFHIIQY